MCGLKTISRVSGKPNVIKVNGVEEKYSSSEARDEAWGRYKIAGYVVPKAPTDFMSKWG